MVMWSCYGRAVRDSVAVSEIQMVERNSLKMKERLEGEVSARHELEGTLQRYTSPVLAHGRLHRFLPENWHKLEWHTRRKRTNLNVLLVN